MNTLHLCNAPIRTMALRRSAITGAAMALFAALGGCTCGPFASDTARASPTPPAAVASATDFPHSDAAAPSATFTTSAAQNTAQNTARARTAAASTRAHPGVAYTTRHAVYTPVGFAELPGWSSDRFDESWAAFLQSCRVLATHAPWSSACADAARVDGRDPIAIRAFFEQRFIAYRIQPFGRPNAAVTGLLTGYYEPVVRGSRGYGGRFIYPVYGVPRDMLYLDARRVPANARGTLTAARIDGRDVIPLPAVSTSTLRGVYVLDLTDAVPDVRDKRIRMRVSGHSIVPYYTRAEIERRGLQAEVIAWVDDPGLIYSMQMQGSAKIVMPDSTVVRVAYADQNGHPFLPAALIAKGGPRSVTRGGGDDDDTGYDAWPSTSAAADEPSASAMADGVAAASAGGVPSLLRGAAEEYGSSDAGAPAATLAAATPISDQDRGVHFANNLVSANAAQAAGRAGSTASLAKSAAMSGVEARPVSTHPGGALQGAAGFAGAPPALKAEPITAAAVHQPDDKSDPSYVFFRSVHDDSNGPLGALGVPLSAGRSIAVDPRTTPLGAPVYLSARTGASGNLNRLMVAQDTGGAIHGAQRADLYWGSGADAQRLASTLKAPAQMWVLLPATLNLSARDSGLRNRSGPASGPHDCLIGDSTFCVDDDTP
ncbi:MltA domain-containing protein [Caballeronia sp. BR00000012568055]|uniref:MltA domain-containing protein n=1 Tax=Caballeronia sp. BR00000012568055 TaxID=2918761 RepID=UPI0023F8D646|nr:MltA domain-containing protein [Caballeronia sp. BR00000012568055]